MERSEKNVPFCQKGHIRRQTLAARRECLGEGGIGPEQKSTGLQRRFKTEYKKGWGSSLPYIEYFVPRNILLNDSSIDSKSGFTAGKNSLPKMLISSWA
ncbi:MAG TPA: hypothetical protein VKP08_18710 [Anaerolineales bacterium]|nr:hypothetical protein [Anaerolineales bacterium]